MVKKMFAIGLSYKEIAKELGTEYCTAVKRRKVTEKTVANLLQAEKDIVKKIERASGGAITDATVRDNGPKSNEILIREILDCNLAEGSKARIIRQLLH
jgi:hypothetical protein